MKNKKGVTLISLVITIIILLILAGVTLSTVSGDNGVITKATKVELEYSKAEVRELLLVQINTKLLKASAELEGSSDDISTKFNEVSVIDYLTNGDPTDEGSPGVKCLIAPSGSGDPDIETVNGDAYIYSIYIIDPTKLSDAVDSYGKGITAEDKFTNKKDVFTLEVITEEIVSEATETDESEDTLAENSTNTKKYKSTGKFELKYYDSDGNETVLDTVNLYLTNQS
jgi:hypothetical protein